MLSTSETNSDIILPTQGLPTQEGSIIYYYFFFLVSQVQASNMITWSKLSNEEKAAFNKAKENALKPWIENDVSVWMTVFYENVLKM